MATTSLWALSGRGPASTPLELHRNVDGRLPPPPPPPTTISCHCWLLAEVSVFCTILAASAVEAFWTSAALPLLRLTSRT